MIEQLEKRTLFSVLFDDEFNGTALDATKWSNTANWGVDHPDSELETYTRTGNLTVANGAATITAKRDANGNWTSDEFQSGGTYAAGGSVKPEFSFLYGYVQMRVLLPSGTGSWPAGWQMPVPNAPGALHDQDGEIDGFEAEGDAPNNVQAHLHHNSTYGATFHGTTPFSAGYHTIGWNWQPGSLTWDVDGVQYAQTTSNVPNVSEFLIVNLAISGGIFGAAPNSSTPSAMNLSLDWIHVTSTKAEAFGGTPTQPANPFDLDGNGSIGPGDLALLAKNYGKKGTNLLGDFDHNGAVDVGDLGAFATVYVNATGQSASQVSAEISQALSIVNATQSDGGARIHRHRQ